MTPSSPTWFRDASARSIIQGCAALALTGSAFAPACEDDEEPAQTTSPSLTPAGSPCLTDCTPRIGIVSAFGAEADILLAETSSKLEYSINGNTFTSGVLGGNPVVIVLSGVSVVNAAMTTQLMIDHFGVTHLLMSGIAGGINPDNHVGDVIVAERWVAPLEAYFSNDSQVPAPCGTPGDLGCLGLRIAQATSTAGSDYQGTGLFMRETHVLTARTAPLGEFKFAFEVDAEMLAVAMTITPELEQCGAADPTACVATQPELKFGGVGISSSLFIANPNYRQYVFGATGAELVDMETAALGQVAYANGIPYLAFRAVSDLAGGGSDEAASVGTFFGTGLAEANEASVTIAFLEAWAARD